MSKAVSCLHITLNISGKMCMCVCVFVCTENCKANVVKCLYIGNLSKAHIGILCSFSASLTNIF